MEISASKLVSPNEVPALLLERRERLAKKLDANGCTRFPYAIPDQKKVKVLRMVFRKHQDLLSPFFSPEVQMVGGLVGKKPKNGLLCELATLKREKWGEKDGLLLSVNDYLRLLRQHNGPTPTFVYFRPDGKVEGAVFPEQVPTWCVTTWGATTGNNTWKNDTIFGDVGICPQICSYMTIGGVGKTLIVQGALPYFTVLSYFNYIYDLLAYSRPAEFGPRMEGKLSPEGLALSRDGLTILEHLPNDPNYAKFHARNNSRLVCIVEGGVEEKYDEKSGGYGFIAGYKPFLCPNGDFLPLLQEIGKSVEKMLKLK